MQIQDFDLLSTVSSCKEQGKHHKFDREQGQKWEWVSLTKNKYTFILLSILK